MFLSCLILQLKVAILLLNVVKLRENLRKKSYFLPIFAQKTKTSIKTTLFPRFGVFCLI